ncbi:MAG: hypothetical protein PHP66_01115 [Syntrophales bacterium]|nr:hypothetical protein [Syntrophales bacterium]
MKHGDPIAADGDNPSPDRKSDRGKFFDDSDVVILFSTESAQEVIAGKIDLLRDNVAIIIYQRVCIHFSKKIVPIRFAKKPAPLKGRVNPYHRAEAVNKISVYVIPTDNEMNRFIPCKIYDRRVADIHRAYPGYVPAIGFEKIIGQSVIFDHQFLKGNLFGGCKGKDKTVQDGPFCSLQFLRWNRFFTHCAYDISNFRGDLEGGFGFGHSISAEQAVIGLRIIETARTVGKTHVCADFLKNSGTETAAADHKVQNFEGIEERLLFGRSRPADEHDRLGEILGQEKNISFLGPGQGRGERQILRGCPVRKMLFDKGFCFLAADISGDGDHDISRMNEKLVASDQIIPSDCTNGITRDEPSTGTACMHQTPELPERQFLRIIDDPSQFLNLQILAQDQFFFFERGAPQRLGKNVKTPLKILLQNGERKNSRFPVDGNLKDGRHRFQRFINGVSGHADGSPGSHRRGR